MGRKTETKELECPACGHTDTYELPEGMDAQCSACGVEIDLIPGVQTFSSQGRAAKGSMSPSLQRFVKTRVEDIDDDPTDDIFIQPKETTSKVTGKLAAFLKKRVEDIDDDPTDDHFLTPEEHVSKSDLKKIGD